MLRMVFMFCVFEREREREREREEHKIHQDYLRLVHCVFHYIIKFN